MVFEIVKMKLPILLFRRPLWLKNLDWNLAILGKRGRDENANRKSCLLKFISYPVRLIVSAMIQCFSLTTKQHQPAYKPQKRSSEQGVSLLIVFWDNFSFFVPT